MMDPRPFDWSSFAEAAGFGGLDPAMVQLMARSSATGADFGFAEGEEIGAWDLPVVSMGSNQGGWWGYPGGGAQSTGDLISSVLASVTRSQPPPIYSPLPPVNHGAVPGGIYEADREEEDWDAVYAAYEVLNETHADLADNHSEEETLVPDFWDIAGGIVDIFQDDPSQPLPGPVYAGAQYQPSSFAPYNPGTNPGGSTKVTVDTKTGKITKCGRRRRRRLLTESDFNDLMRISTLPNKETVRVALAKAVGRSR